MKLDNVELEELNDLLDDNSLDIPDIRREVGDNGRNLKWLKKHLSTRNSRDQHPRLFELVEKA